MAEVHPVTVKSLKKIIMHMTHVRRDGAYIPLMIWGEAGIGKSQAVYQAAEALWPGQGKEHVIELRVGTMDPSDLIGLPTSTTFYPCPFCYQEDKTKYTPYREGELLNHCMSYHKDDDRLKNTNFTEFLSYIKQNYGGLIQTRTEFQTADWFPSEGSEGILFLDEVNRGTPATIQAVFQLLLDRRIHMSQLPPGWIIVSACNPPQGGTIINEGSLEIHTRYTVDTTINNDLALASRFLHLALVLSPEEWLEWATENNVDKSIIAYISRSKSSLGIVWSYLPTNLSPTPRSLELLSRIKYRELEMPSAEDRWALVKPVVTGILGIKIWDSFETALTSGIDSAPTGKDIVERYKQVRESITDIFSRNKNLEIRRAWIRLLIERVAHQIKDVGADILSKGEVNNVVTFIGDLRGFVKEATELQADIDYLVNRNIPEPILSALRATP